MSEEALAGRMFWFQRQAYLEDRTAVGTPGQEQVYRMPDVGGEAWNVLAAKFWLNLIGTRRSQSLKRNSKTGKAEGTHHENPSVVGGFSEVEDDGNNHRVAPGKSPARSPNEGPLGTALLHYVGRWRSYGTALVTRSDQVLRTFWQLWVRHGDLRNCEVVSHSTLQHARL